MFLKILLYQELILELLHNDLVPLSKHLYLVFYFLGVIIRYTLDYFDAQNEAVRREEVDSEKLEKEKEILRAQALNEGKPEKIVDRMVEGRIEKYYKEVCLLEQPFVKDGDKNIKGLMAEIAKEAGAALDIVRFSRFERGEGIEKRKDDLAAEIAAMKK